MPRPTAPVRPAGAVSRSGGSSRRPQCRSIRMDQIAALSDPAATSDPIVVEIVRGALKAVQHEMEALIERTAMSPFIREKKDFHAALFNRTGKLIAGRSLPTASNLIEPVLERYPAQTMRPGDIYWYN